MFSWGDLWGSCVTRHGKEVIKNSKWRDMSVSKHLKKVFYSPKLVKKHEGNGINDIFI